MADPILTPRCPLCGQPPAAGLGASWLATWFCGNEECPALTWDPTKPLDELLMNVGPVEITHNVGREEAEHRRRVRPGLNPDGLWARAVSVKDPARVVFEHPITDLNAATSSNADNDQVNAWLAEHSTDEVHVYIYDGDSGECVQTIIVKGEAAP